MSLLDHHRYARWLVAGMHRLGQLSAAALARP